MERKYFPTFAELCDRLSIVLLKQIFILENRAAYIEERKLIEHDLDEMLCSAGVSDPAEVILTGESITALLMVAITNRFIWENESKARQGGSEQDKLLRLTHSVNGCRNRAKNVLSRAAGQRVDLKVDCLAADLPKEFGNWNVFDDTPAA